jgi:hypothetical protein
VTPTLKLRQAKSQCEEAKSHYNKAQLDPGLKSYATSQLKYVGDLEEAIDKELFVRG